MARHLAKVGATQALLAWHLVVMAPMPLEPLLEIPSVQ